jgi:DNA-binding NtrC family response regulator
MASASSSSVAPTSVQGGFPAEEASGLVLLVDDEPLFLRALERILRPLGHRLQGAGTLEEVRVVLGEPELEVILLDLRLAGTSGLDVLAEARRLRPEVEVVMMTGHATIESAVSAMREGAFDYLEKPFEDVHRVRNTVARALERGRLVRRNAELERELEELAAHPTLIGTSPEMRGVIRRIDSLRHNESTVLVQGESGTGKELVAAALHAASPRRNGPFVPVDCGALPEAIIESELFGHERGAFTGAQGAPGLFRVADGGTLFLDEVGEVPLGVQAKLLRALQQKEVRPVGGATPQSVDIRVVCATHRDLAAMVRDGSFRADLYYRLDVVRLALPPLRERRQDVPLLAQHFLEKHRRADASVLGFEPEALAALSAHDWPGNVRELENAVESGLALSPGPRLRASDLQLHARVRPPRERPPVPADLSLSLAAYERCALERALAESGGDASAAARRLGVARSTFYRKLAQHGISAGRDRRSAPAAGGPEAIR